MCVVHVYDSAGRPTYCIERELWVVSFMVSGSRNPFDLSHINAFSIVLLLIMGKLVS